MKHIEILPGTSINGMGVCSSKPNRYRSAEIFGWVVVAVDGDMRLIGSAIYHTRELAEIEASRQREVFPTVQVDRVTMNVEFTNEADGYQAYSPSFDEVGRYLG